MTHADLVAKKLVRIETCVRELRDLAKPESLKTDVKEQRFVEHTLQIAIEAALDVASHVVSDQHLGEPETNHALFDLLSRNGWVPLEMLATLHSMVGLRNVVVHEYDDVDLDILKDVLANRLGDLIAFVDAIRKKLPKPGAP